MTEDDTNTATDAQQAERNGPEVRRWLVFRPADEGQRQAELTGLAWLESRIDGPRAIPAAPSSSSVPSRAAADATVSPPPGPADEVWLTAPSGWPGDAMQNQIQADTLLAGLAAALVQLHALEPTAELDRLDSDALIDAADARVRRGLIDAERIDPSRRHVAPGALVDQLRALAPMLQRRAAVTAVVTHGSCHLGSVWVERGEPTGFIDVRRLAVADPYRDLGAMARSLARFFGPEALPGFFAAYGLPEPDPIRLEFHALLDELT